ncbi:unnamed protein product [Caenorhabditis sp. 36 PRJEB53466]|nr:unnamed protein product [Caenorhabditis sp. 36 PRJEB53466]
MSSLICMTATLLLVLGHVNTGDAIPTSPVVASFPGVNTACTRASIEAFCKPEHLFCVRSACSQCILRDPFNPFASFCARLTDCVCSISNDPQCEQKVEETCY